MERRETHLQLLIDFAKGAEISYLIYFITFVGMLLGPVFFLILKSEVMLDMPSSVVVVMMDFFIEHIFEMIVSKSRYIH